MGVNATCGPGGTELSSSRPLQAPLRVGNFLLAFQECRPEPAAHHGAAAAGVGGYIIVNWFFSFAVLSPRLCLAASCCRMAPGRVP